MNSEEHNTPVDLNHLSDDEWVLAVGELMEREFQAGRDPSVSDFLGAEANAHRPALLVMLLRLRWSRAAEEQLTESYHSLLAEYPDQTAEIDAAWSSRQRRLGENGGQKLTVANSVSQPGDDTWRGRETSAAESSESGPAPTIGKFEILESIGKGGFGEVYRARDKQLGRIVAVKVPRYGSFRTEQERQRFFREARSAASLDHPHICRILEIGSHNDQTFIVMGFVEGETLSEHLKSCSPSVRELAELVSLIAEAVHYAHEQQVVHRDLKPENVMIDRRTGQPVLMDFGLAKDLAREGEAITEDGDVMGTPAFMSPEQARGDIEAIGATSDVYSLGAVLYYSLTGRAPFSGNVLKVLLEVQHKEPKPVRTIKSNIHRDLETICLTAMAKEPQRRYATAADFAADLRRFSQGEPIAASRENLLEAAIRRVRRNPVSSTIIFLASFALLAAAIYGFFAVNNMNRGNQQRRIASLVTSIRTEIESSQWSSGELHAIESQIEELEIYAEDEAKTQRQLLASVYANYISNLLESPRLTESVGKQIESHLLALEKRSPTAALKLRERLQQRSGRWDTLYELTPTSGDSSMLSHTIRIDGDAIRLDAKSSRTVTLNTPSNGNVEIDCDFVEPWGVASTVGVELNHTEAQSYAFRVRREAASSSENQSIKDEPARAPKFHIEILRNSVVIQSRQMGEDQVEDSLRMRARRVGSQLSLWINAAAPVVIDDLFPLPTNDAGVFAIRWPAEVAVRAILVRRQTSSTSPSPLEAADQLFAREAYQQAIDAYARQEVSGIEVAQCQYKQAIALLRLNRTDEATDLLERAMASEGKRWPPLAACQLWVLRIQQNRRDEAWALFDVLDGRFHNTDFVQTVPTEIRNEMLALAQDAIGWGTGIKFRQTSRVDEARKVVRLSELLDFEMQQHRRMKRELVLALEIVGELDEAVRLARENTLGLPESDNVHDYTRLLAKQGKTQFALEELDRIVQATGRPLALQRSQLLTRLNRLDEARRELVQNNPMRIGNDSRMIARAYLLLGLIHRLQGNERNAQIVWRNGANVLENLARKPHSEIDDLYWHLMKSLTGDFSQADSSKMFQSGLSQLGASGKLLPSFVSPPVVHGVLSEMYRGKRGQEFVEQFAVRSISREETSARIVALAGETYLSRHAFVSDVSPRREELMQQVVANVVTACLRTGELKIEELPLLAGVWKGYFSWTIAAPQFNRELRPELAYMVAHRLLKLGKIDSAVACFQDAANHAPPDSLLHELALADLQLAESKEGEVAVVTDLKEALHVTIATAGGENRQLMVESKAPARITTAAGVVRLMIDDPPEGVKLNRAAIQVSPASYAVVKIALAKFEPTRIQWGAAPVASPAGARIFLGDVLLATPDNERFELMLPVGEHTIRIESTDDAEMSVHVSAVKQEANP